jgi:hypothetical protein
MQLFLGQWSQRLAHDEQEEVFAELLAALAEGGVTESHAEKMAQALGGVTGKRQRVGDQSDNELPAERDEPLPAKSALRQCGH